MADTGRRYSIQELADLAGISRRTVRYYVQEGLLPEPLGVGRGSHYDESHLERLLEVRALQESGRSLDAIKAGSSEPPASPRRPAAAPPGIRRSAWRRLDLAPGVELHLASSVRLPPGHRLDELAEWCRRHLSSGTEDEE